MAKRSNEDKAIDDSPEPVPAVEPEPGEAVEPVVEPVSESHAPELQARPEPEPVKPQTLSDHFRVQLANDRDALANCLVALHDFKRAVEAHLPDFARSL